MNFPFSRAGDRKGFTLIELLVVISIIAVLSAIVLANFSDARKKSRDAKRLADVAELQLALELFYGKYREFPTALGNGQLAPAYIASIPVPPAGAGQTEYAYVPLGTSCTSYHLGAVLESDNQAFTEDADATRSTTLPASGVCGGSGSVPSSDFAGLAADCSQTSAGSTDRCYDVKP
jgi:general secretion pathway protein G